MGKGIILHFIIRFLLKIFFRVQVIDIEHYTNAGDRVLLVSNCGSLLDPLLLSCFLNNRITVAIDSKIYKKWWIRPFLLCSKILEADFNSPISTLKLVNALEKH